jgi:GDPmannose 4,6-dehydratase
LLLDKVYWAVGLVRQLASCEVTGARLRWLGILDGVRLVAASWHQPVLTGQLTWIGAANLLEAVRIAHPEASYYRHSVFGMFGKVWETRECETTPFQFDLFCCLEEASVG